MWLPTNANVLYLLKQIQVGFVEAMRAQHLENYNLGGYSVGGLQEEVQLAVDHRHGLIHLILQLVDIQHPQDQRDQVLRLFNPRFLV